LLKQSRFEILAQNLNLLRCVARHKALHAIPHRTEPARGVDDEHPGKGLRVIVTVGLHEHRQQLPRAHHIAETNAV